MDWTLRPLLSRRKSRRHPLNGGGGCYIGTRGDLRVWWEDELLGGAELAAVPVLSAVGVSTEVCQMSLRVLCSWTEGGPCRVTSSLNERNPVDLTVLC